ncbi:carboxymuconolactone decarboxylase family protein [Undibacterium sp. SXout20W]|uniref:carboxymuconolactone decarboxylase family protein n=1 Tax=Undibacterium sp. SXout20W TaxID=3413051 RepID=UPI003BF449B8
MTYINSLSIEQADPTTAATLNAVKAQIGMIPNLFSTLAKSPTALNSLLGLNQTIGTSALSASEREIIALATSQANSCQYCVSAHSLLGKNAGLNAEQLINARSAKAGNDRASAIASFTKALVEQRGHVAPEVLDQFKANGLSEADLLEIIANVVATTFTNYTNNVARTVIDFPVVALELNS